MATLIDRIQKSLDKEGLAPRTRQSRAWLQNKISSLNASQRSLFRDVDRTTRSAFVGHMYFFYYDPKHKEKLPYYDRFPLVLVLEIYKEGFLGLNLHYLPIRQRIGLLDNLMEYADLDKNKDILRMRVTYDILNASKRFKEFKPCLKKYLFGHVQSKILAVQQNEWDIACMLPIQQFRKATTSEVWQDSLEQIRK